MNRAWMNQLSVGKWIRAGLSAAFAIAVGATAHAAGQDAAAANAAAAAHACGCLYSVINLDPGDAVPLLNEKGQVAIQNFLHNTQRFFDGDRLHDLGSLGSDGYTLIRGLNDLGVVVGESDDDSQPFGQLRGFSWTLAGGMRALPGQSYASAFAINDRNQSAGYMGAPGVTARAVRWDPDGTVLDLGPLPFSLSQAYAINDRGLVAGFTDTPDRIHAAVWTPAGKLIDLGTLGGQTAFAEFVNRRGEVAGVGDNPAGDGQQAFFWSARDGLVPIGAMAASGTLLNAMNDRGELVGDINDAAGGDTAFVWSRARGLRLLPRGDAVVSLVSGVNNKSEMSGLLRNAAGVERAVRWDGLADPVDLNTLLYRPPAGLKLQAAVAINDAGVILAASNAGLVMLRPGTQGTNAPVLGPITGLPDSVDVGQDLRLTLGFVDNAPSQTHTAAVSWNDGCTSPHPLVRESGGVGTISLQHHFCTPGYYTVTVRVTDSGGRVTEASRDVTVNTPGVATIGGQGTLTRATGSAAAKTPLQFALWAPAGTASAGAAAGPAFVSFGGPFRFRSDQVGPPARSGQQVRLEGTGRLNGRAGYRFLVEATAGDARAAGNGGRVRLRVAHTDAAGVEAVDFDNGAPASTAALSSTNAPDRTLVVHGGVELHD